MKVESGIPFDGDQVQAELSALTVGQKVQLSDDTWVCKIGRLVFSANSEMELDNTLAYFSLQTHKPLAEITFEDLITLSDSEYYMDLVDNTDLYTVELRSTGQAKVDAVNAEYFTESLPAYPAGSESFLDWTYSSSAVPTEVSADFAGLVSTAQTFYTSSYPDATLLPAVNPSPEVLGLLTTLFGSSGPFNQGHMNVLQMMGLISGTETTPDSQWALTESGTALMASAASNTVTYYAPSMSLLNLASVRSTLTEVQGCFDASGNFVSGKGPTEIKNAAETVLASMPADTAAATFTDSGNAAATLNFLFGLPTENTSFTVAQLNTAIAMGLITYDPAAGSATLTPAGSAFFNQATIEATPPVSESPLTKEQYLEDPTIQAINGLTIDEDEEAYNDKDLLELGLPPQLIGWLMNNFGDDEGRVPKEVISYLLENGYLEGVEDAGSHSYNDKTNQSSTLFMTEKLVDLVSLDPDTSLGDAATLVDYYDKSIGLVNSADYWKEVNGGRNFRDELYRETMGIAAWLN